MLNFYRFLCLLLLSDLSSIGAFAQGPGRFPALTLIPPSPEAANLGRYAANPISYYTGTPQLAVPLVEIEAGPLKLPLTLSYNASGNRVEDMASWVGLGWALNAGGVITRTVRGAADDQQPSSPTQGLNFFDVTRTFTYSQLASATANVLDTSPATQMLVDAARGCADVQPDIFYFNFNGYTGQFSFDWNRQLVVSSSRNVRIEPTYVRGAIASWRVTTEDGTVYAFKDAEWTTSKPKTFNVVNCAPAQGHRFVSTWYLSSVTDVNREHRLTFFYDNYRLNYGLRMVDAIENGIGHCADITDIGINRSSQSFSSIDGLRLKRICASTGSDTTATVELVPTAAHRTDTVGLGSRNTNLKALDHVTLRDGTNREVQTAFLTYAPNNPTGRLTLSQVQQGRLAGAKLPGHVFAYNTRVRLPANIQSRAQDHWGFYNGADGNDAIKSLVPGCSLPALFGRVITRAGAERGVNPLVNQAGILQKITYPTGGYSTFEYDSNEYGYVNDLSVNDVTSNTIRIFKEISTGGAEFLPKLNYCFSHTRTFTISPSASATNATVSWNVFAGNAVGAHKPYVTLDGPGGTVLHTIAGYCAPKNGTTIKSLYPGQYILTARVCTPTDTLEYDDNSDGPCNGHGYASADISVAYDSLTKIAIIKKLAGGLRIRRIRDYAGRSDSLYTEKTFAYTEPANPKGSSGCIYGEPKYEYLSSYMWRDDNLASPGMNGPFVPCDYWLRIARNRTSLGAMQGSHIGYRQVTVTNLVQHQLHSQSVYRFTSPVDYPDGITDDLPFPPALAFGHRTGLLLEQTDYHGAHADSVAVKKTENAYRFYEVSVPALAVANPNALPPGSGGVAGYIGFFKQPYTVQLGHAQPSRTRETFYATAGKLGHTQEQVFAYDSAGTRVRTQTQRLGSGTARGTTHWYSTDYATPPGSVYARMADDLHVLEPIESVTTRQQADTAVVGARWQGFAIQGGKLRLTKARMLRAAAPIPVGAYRYSAANGAAPDARLEEHVVIDRYDEAGNVTQLHPARGLPVARLWGYGRSLLLAEVQNATYNDLVRVLGQSVVDQLAGLTPGTDAVVRAALQPLRTQLPGARVLTYTHRPLVGVTSQTDPAGRTVTYEYDEFNRLLRTRDEQGRILSQQQYHYARP